MNTCNSFFETKQKNFLIHPNITFCYIYVTNSPESLLMRYKEKYNSPEASYNELFNFSNQPYLSKDQENQKFKVFENRTIIIHGQMKMSLAPIREKLFHMKNY